MKTVRWMLVAGLAMVLLVTGCDKMMGFSTRQQDGVAEATDVPPMGRRYNNNGNWFLFFYNTPSNAPGTTFLVSLGQDNGATGSYVKVWKDEAAQKMYAEFHMADGWYVRTAHFTVKEDSASLEHNKKGNLVPGQFPGQTENSYPYPQTALVEVDWGGPWGELAMAVHCEAAQGTYDPVGDTWYYGTWETGWGGEGDRPDPDKKIVLPDFPVTMSFKRDYPVGDARSHWIVTLSGIGDENAGYNVWDGVWVGWCANRYIFMDLGLYNKEMAVRLYSCYDPALPPVYQNDGWDNVSWLVNAYSGSNWETWGEGWDNKQGPFNEVIYYLLGQWNDISWLPVFYQEMAALAKTEGEGYYPSLPGSWFAVICDPVETPELEFQPIFIEVDP